MSSMCLREHLWAENEHKKKKKWEMVNRLHPFYSSACLQIKIEMRVRTKDCHVLNSESVKLQN